MSVRCKSIDDKFGPEFIAVNHQGLAAMAVSAAKNSDSGVEIRRFKKDMLSVGQYIHPTAKWRLDVTVERLHRFAAAFKSMRENGVDVEIPLGHYGGAEKNLGYVVDMFVEPNSKNVPTLWGIHEIRGNRAIEVIERNKNVSVAIEKDYTDGKGKNYGEVIVHSSIVDQPVVPGQGEFEIAASIRDKRVKIPIFILNEENKETTMFTVKELQEALGAGEDLTEENALERVKASLAGKDDEIAKMSKDLVDATAAAEAAAQKQASSDGSGESKKLAIDPNLAEQMGVTAEQQLSLLVQSGKITPDVQKELLSSLVGESGKRNLVALSIRSEGRPSMLSAVVTALTKNDVVKLGEQTKLQVLSRAEESGGNDRKANQECGDIMVAAVGGTVEKKS